MFGEKRVGPRESLNLPLRLGDGRIAVARDISAFGMYLQIQGAYSMSGPVVFEMEVAELGLKFTADGEIVRVDRHETGTGFAIRLRNPRLEPLVIAPFLTRPRGKGGRAQ